MRGFRLPNRTIKSTIGGQTRINSRLKSFHIDATTTPAHGLGEDKKNAKVNDFEGNPNLVVNYLHVSYLTNTAVPPSSDNGK
jgi:hypothetical protein